MYVIAQIKGCSLVEEVSLEDENEDALNKMEISIPDEDLLYIEDKSSFTRETRHKCPCLQLKSNKGKKERKKKGEKMNPKFIHTSSIAPHLHSALATTTTSSQISSAMSNDARHNTMISKGYW